MTRKLTSRIVAMSVSLMAAFTLTLASIGCSGGNLGSGGGGGNAPTVTLTANPSSVTLGDSATVTVATTGADSCTGADGLSGMSVPTNGTVSVKPTASGATKYTANCSGPGGSASGSVTITVNAAATITIAAPVQLQLGVKSPSTYTLTCTVTGVSDTGCVFALTGSGDANRATLTQTGATTAYLTPSDTNTGTVTVTATSNSGGATAEATVPVVNKLWVGTGQGYGTINADGTGLSTNFLPGSDLFASPSYDSLKVVAVNFKAAAELDVYQLTPTGVQQTATLDLTTLKDTTTGNPITMVDTPHFSRDGSLIVFTGIEDGKNAQTQGIYTIAPDGKTGAVQKYQQTNASTTSWNPVFSPDDKYIIFQDAATKTVWIMNADGSNPHQYVSAPSTNAFYSPHGSTVYYNGLAPVQNNAPGGVYAMNADGTNVRALITDTSYYVTGVAPNGAALAVGHKETDAYIYNLSTGTLTLLRANGGDPAWGN